MPLIDSTPIAMRRLPIYIVIGAKVFKDQSYISLVDEAIHCLLHSWKNDPWMLDVATMSVICGNLINLQQSDIYEIRNVDIKTDGDIPMNETLDLMKECLNSNIVRTTREHKGDWKPLIIFFITGSRYNSLIHKFISDYTAENRVYSNSLIISKEVVFSDNDKNNFEVKSQIINRNSINNIRFYSEMLSSEWNSFWSFVAESYSNVSGRNLSLGMTVYNYFMNNNRQSPELNYIHP